MKTLKLALALMFALWQITEIKGTMSHIGNESIHYVLDLCN